MGVDHGGDGGTSSRVLGMLLTWMSEKTAPVFVVATANDVTKLPPELMRKGRFDEIFFADLPTDAERDEIFRIHLQKKKRNPDDFDVAGFVAKSLNFSGSEIEQSVKAALYMSFDANRELTDEDIMSSLTMTVPLAKTMETQLEAIREWAKGRARPAAGPEAKKKGKTISSGRAFGG